MRSLLLTLHCAALAALASCANMAPRGTSFASEPAGASVRVDGRDSGWVTPCEIALDEAEPHVVTLALEGYAPHDVQLEPLQRHGIVHWRQGVNGVKTTIRFPILLPAFDLLIPFRELNNSAPDRVFVRLRPEGAP